MRLPLAFFGSLVTAASLQAQWRTEQFDVLSGWSAFHLPIDTETASIEALLAAYPAIEEVWQWRPEDLEATILDDPEAPVVGAEWRFWRRGDEANSTLSVLAPHRAYLVKSTADVTLELKGRVVAPEVQWRTDGLNLLGFLTNTDTPPTAEAFLEPAGVLDQQTEIFGYVGGPLIEDTNPQQHQAKFTPVRRNRAFWLRTSKYADYDGPVRVRTAFGDSLDFGEDVPTQRLVLANRTDREMTVMLSPQASEAAPGVARAPSSVPLLRQVTDASTGERSYVPFGTNHNVVLRARETLGLVVAVDRASLVGPVGTESASLLQVTDNEGIMEVYLPVRATVTNLHGLWIGVAEVSHVQNQLSVGTNEVQPTAQGFPLTLIVHIDEAGQATLLSQAYLGIVDEDEDLLPVTGVSSEESLLLTSYSDGARRFTSTHLPLNTAMTFSGSAVVGGTVSGMVTIGHDSPSNPFLHLFHPDHDNLDERFENVLPSGVESHTIVREISLTLHSGAPEGLNDPAWGTSVLTGEYAESLSGLHKNAIATRGVFALRKAASKVALRLP